MSNAAHRCRPLPCRQTSPTEHMQPSRLVPAASSPAKRRGR
ncbi:Uncharacterised protein [Mycobacteroides abscessus subsp. abscessus]|jgi:hypothetical protein|nr:Uncharacterised protein [Mycobacteroides abscessus subsp. abscessus]